MNEFNTKGALIASLAIRSDKEYSALYDNLKKFKKAGSAFTQGPLFISGLCETARIALFASLFHEKDINILENNTCVLIVPDEKTAYRTKAILANFISNIAVFPTRDFVFHNVAAASMEWEHERLSILKGIVNGKINVVITVPEGALGFLPPKENINCDLTLNIGDTIDNDKLQKALINFGYTLADTVEGKGQYSRRGDILDIFIPCEESPIRMEFFGDELDAAGYFEIMSQRRTDNVQKVTITPTREIVPNEAMKEKIISAIDTQILNVKHRRNKENNLKENTISKLQKEKDDLQNFELYNIDKYMSVIFDKKECLLDYAQGFIGIFDYPKVKERQKTYEWQINESIISLSESGEINAKNASFCFDLEDLKIRLCRRPAFISDTFLSTPDIEISGLYTFSTKQISPFTQSLDVFCEDLKNYLDLNYKTIVVTDSTRSANALNEIISENGIKNVLLAESESEISKLSDKCVYILPITLPKDAIVFSGFELTKSKFVILTEASTEGGGDKRASNKVNVKKEKKNRILSLTDISEGDYVVHTVHGIAQYIGIKTLNVGGITRDYITLRYAGTDTLYVPTDQLDRISKYAGSGENVRLTKMGSVEWTKTTARVKKAAKDMAKQLILLYAERQKMPGYSFAPDGEWQQDFEDRFEYDETDGQIEAIMEIKKDMEKPCPMDRLLCGDVGFGKTEVALRAAFKCVMEGKQVAILVPTTILAWQHFQTVLGRLHGFPISSEMISRFRSQKQIKEIKKKLELGEIDIIIGTHSLLQKTVIFKDLGLLIVDEEQRFGVAHKERLKEMSKQVDVLTLSATPIPRTFNMALVGIRDMSILDEAPQNRYPVQTYVLEYDGTIIAEAIKKELRRGGQVFYLFNKVEGIEAVAERLRNIVPEAVIEIAHGKMDEETLSEIWKDLVDGKIDILVCTTIIETGVDIPNANTLIIENADRLGLSQLHQIRGRVGRSNRRAYAYFTWRRETVLNEIAMKRLSAIREFTEFGSGFKIAMRDLEIRGAGNLLGAEQSGQMESVGYDMFVKILEEAVLEEKGIAVKKRKECAVDLQIDAYIPEIYIKRPAGRIEMYKKIAAIENNSDADEVFDEMLDRYGDMPTAVKNLINVSKIRAWGASLDIIKIEQKEEKLCIYPKVVSNDLSAALVVKFKSRLLLSMGKNPCYNIKLSTSERVSDIVENVLNVFEKTRKVKDE